MFQFECTKKPTTVRQDKEISWSAKSLYSFLAKDAGLVKGLNELIEKQYLGITEQGGER